MHGVQRPAKIVNYRSMGATPLILGLGLTVGTVAALGLTLVASVRRRRQLHGDAADARLHGAPAESERGLAIKRRRGDRAGGRGAARDRRREVPVGSLRHQHLRRARPTVPALAIVAIALGALGVGNLVAAIAGPASRPVRRRRRCMRTESDTRHKASAMDRDDRFGWCP